MGVINLLPPYNPELRHHLVTPLPLPTIIFECSFGAVISDKSCQLETLFMWNVIYAQSKHPKNYNLN